MQDPRIAPTLDALRAENAALRTRLEEAEDTLRAIREGEVDAIIVSGSQGDRVFSLAETENLHRQMVETMNEAGLAISPDGLLLYCNERAAALLRRSRSALLGRRLAEFVAPQDADRLSALLAASAEGTADDRVVFRAANEEAVPLHLWASQLRRAGGPLICLVGTDLSRLEAERALVVQLQEQQQALNASRAEALDLMSQAVTAHEKATRAAEDLLKADRRKDAFLATLAHELRNPLAPIRNALASLSLSLSEAAVPDTPDALAIIERQFTHLVRLLDDLLDVSRITRGKIDLRKEPVEISTIISSAVETVQPLIEAAGQHLSVNHAPRRLWLEADPVRLGQVFGNLLNNATKYTKPGGEIHLNVESSEDEVHISVRDTGDGIPEELLPHIFELFRQGDQNQSRAQSGLGIGLSLVKCLTELHGGRVDAFSAGAGQGSEIRVVLPRLREPPAKRPEPSRHRDLPDLSPACRILVVDDNQDAANSLGNLLARQGGQVEIAFDGTSALERFDAQCPDLVILDIGMPRMDGHEVARRIRARAVPKQPTLIAMSGLGQEADRQRSLQAGFDYHLVKPVAFDVLDSLLSARWGLRPESLPNPSRSAAPRPEIGALARPSRSFGTADAGERSAAPETNPETPRLQTLLPMARAAVHELAQPLNTAACYAIAARNLAAKSTDEATPLCNALRGIDQQIRCAGTAMERLRQLLGSASTADSGNPEETRIA